jgi:hypothetical protein
MTSRTIMQMEIHPAIIRRNQLRASVRQAAELVNSQFKRMERQLEMLSHQEFIAGPLGLSLTLRKPQRFQHGSN